MLKKKHLKFYLSFSTDPIFCDLNLSKFKFLTPKLPSYRNQFIDLLSKPIGWFLYGEIFGVVFIWS